MKIWGIVRNAAGLILSRYVDGDLKQPNLTTAGNVAVEQILVTPGGLVPAVAETDSGAIVAGQTTAFTLSLPYVFDPVAGHWIRPDTLPDNADAQAALGVGALGTVARLQGWNGATYDRLRSGTNNADGEAPATGSLRTGSRGYLFNETTWDRQRGNVEGTALASAVRNGGPFNSADILAYNARGIIGFLNITAVPGVVTVNARFQFKDPASGVYIDAPPTGAGSVFGPLSVSTAATGLLLFQIGNINQSFNTCIIPRTWRILTTHSGAGNFTYSVGYSLMY